MSADDNVALLRRLCEAYGRKDVAPLFDCLDEAVQFHFAAHPDHFSFAGTHAGRDGIARAVSLIARDFDCLDFRARDFIAEGDRVAALTEGVIQHRGTGNKLDIRMVDIVRLSEGRIVEFTEFFDTGSILAASEPRRRARAKDASNVAKARTPAKPKGRRAQGQDAHGTPP